MIPSTCCLALATTYAFQCDKGAGSILHLLNVCVIDLVQNAIIGEEVAPFESRSFFGVEVQGIALQVGEGRGLPVVHLKVWKMPGQMLRGIMPFILQTASRASNA
jgi:hypothetical protein